jgi:site-specific recombinase
MLKFFKKAKPQSLEIELQLLFEKEFDDDISLLLGFINIIRPKIDYLIDSQKLNDAFSWLKLNREQAIKLSNSVKSVLNNRHFHEILTESGIINSTRFREEIIKRTISKFIPFQPEKDTLEYVFNQLFYLDTDIIWLRNINIKQWENFTTILDFDANSLNEEKFNNELYYSLNLLSQRMSGLALDHEIIKMLPEFEMSESPFEKLEKSLISFQSAINDIQQKKNAFQSLMLSFSKCEDYIEKALENSKIFGISLSVNQRLLKITMQLNRFKKIVEFIYFDEKTQQSSKIDFMLYLIELNCKKNNIKSLISESTQIVTYEITQHTAKTGEHYISNNKKEYFKMLYTASGGGVIVGFLCVFKLLLSKVDVSDFGHAFLYSMNYAFGFILIYLLGFTLATKQPAMTAAALVKTIEKGIYLKNKNKHIEFAIFFSKLFRTQFVAFVGNVLLAFPVSLGLIFLIDYFFNTNIATSKSSVLIKDLSPIQSLLILHAAIAGFFLFLAGIISGAISNRNKFYNLYYRIEEHPWLKMTFGKEKSNKIANWFRNNWPGVASNFWFGIFLGSTASIGAFLGLNLDIRHITFGSGNLALGLYGTNFDITFTMLFWSIIGIACIGFVNFIVSFLLSLYVAFKSRNIPTSELKYLFISVWYYFKTKPFSFFLP